jgi:hypothetical protein
MICRVWAAQKWPAGRQQLQQQQVEIREPGPWSWFTVARSGRGVKRLAAARYFGTGRCYSLLLKGEEPGESRNEWRLVCIQLRGLVAGVFVCPTFLKSSFSGTIIDDPPASKAWPAQPAQPAQPVIQHIHTHSIGRGTIWNTC